MSVNYRIEDLFASVDSSFCSMISALAFGNHLDKYGTKYVYPNLRNIALSANYYIPIETQQHALMKRGFVRFSIAAGLRGVFAPMYEMLVHSHQFKKTTKGLLKETFEPFLLLIKFLRHIYSHDFTWTIEGDILLKKQDFISFARRQRKKNIDRIHFDFLYSDKLPEITNPIGYGIQIMFSLSDLKAGKYLSEIISQHDQIVLAELCVNLCRYLSQRSKNRE